MASISLYDENQLCKIIEPAGAPNQLFYIHEVPAIVEILKNADDPNPNIKLELYPIIEDNEKNIDELDVKSLIINQNCNNTNFDFTNLFKQMFPSKTSNNEVNFIGTFENCIDFKLSTLMMNHGESNLVGFNDRYPHLRADYLKSHMTDTFRNVAISELTKTVPKNTEQYLAYNLVLAWTEYIKTMYDEYVKIVWSLLRKKFNISDLNYEWSPSGLLEKNLENISTVIEKTLKYEQIKTYLNGDIKKENEYQKIFNDNTEKEKFDYAIDSVYILIGSQIENVVDDFKNILNNRNEFKFGYDLTPTTITTNFKNWLSSLNEKLININTKYFDINVIDKIDENSKLNSIKGELSYNTFVSNWGTKFSKNVELIISNSEKINQTLAKDFYDHLNANRYVNEWDEYYKILNDLFNRIATRQNKTLKDDLFNDLVISIAYDANNKEDTNIIQRKFYKVLGEYSKDYSISPLDITTYLKNTKVDNKRFLQAAIEKRFSEYEFKNVLNILSGNINDIIYILKNPQNIENKYKNSSLYNKFVSLFKICNPNNTIINDYFITFDKSIKLFNDEYVCDFKSDLFDYITVQLDKAFESPDNQCETVFSSDSEIDKLFAELKTNGNDLISKNIISTIDTLNKVEVKYLHNLLENSQFKDNFTENAAQIEYTNYCNVYANKFMLFNASTTNIEDYWGVSFNIMIDTNSLEITPKTEFSSKIEKYYKTVKIPDLQSQYIDLNNKANPTVADIQFCINSLSNYLYDTGCYGKKSGFKDNYYAQKSIIIDSVLNRVLDILIPMKLNNSDENYIYEIIENLEAKVRELENRELDEKQKQEEFNRNVNSYKAKLQEYVDKCKESLSIAIENYYALKNENIPNEYQSAVSPESYYEQGKINLKDNSFKTLVEFIDGKENETGNADKLKLYINNPNESYDETLFKTCSIYYNSAKGQINNYESFLITEGFNSQIDKLNEFGALISDYQAAYEERSTTNSDEITEE